MRMMSLEFHNGLPPEEALQFEANPEVYLAGGEDMYRKQQWVGCEQVGHFVRQLDDITRRLP
jgi:hypothetical protein